MIFLLLGTIRFCVIVVYSALVKTRSLYFQMVYCVVIDFLFFFSIKVVSKSDLTFRH